MIINLKYFKYLLPVSLFLILVFIFNFNGLYGQDSYEYLRYTNALREFLLNGTDPGDFFWPIGFPLAGALISFIIPDTNFVLQFISISAFAGILFLSSKIIRELYTEVSENKVSLYLLLTLAFSPYFFRNAVFAMSDMLSIFFYLVVFYLMISAKNRNSILNLVLITGFLLISINIRNGAVSILLIPFIYFLIQNLKDSKSLAVTIFFLLVFVFLMTATGLKVYQMPLEHTFTNWSISNFISSDFESTANSNYRLINLIYVLSVFFHPGFLAPGFILILFIKKQDILNSNSILILCAIIPYMIMLAGFDVQNNRFLISILPFIVILLYPAFERILNYFNNYPKIRLSGIYLLLTIQISLSVYAILPSYNMNKFEKEVATYINDIERDMPVYTFAINQALVTYGVENVRNLYVKEYKNFESGSLVLFKEAHFLAKNNTSKNLKFINENYHIELIKHFNHGWLLYEIQ